MKNLLLILALSLSAVVSAQLEVGLKAGVATESLQGERFDLSHTGRADLSEAIVDGEYGFQFGGLLRIPFSDRFGLQAEVTFNSAKTDFRLNGPDNNSTAVLTESYHDVNIPIMGSWKIAFIRLNAGPVGHFYLDSASDLRDAEGRERTFDTFTLGYTAGVALDISSFTFDVRYDGNFSDYGEEFAIAGETFRVDQSASRWIGSVAYRF